MRYREFGSTGLKVSQLGFGAWPIGGTSYGAVDEDESLRALAVAEELGCNFVDTASVYGNSEQVLGKFMQGRRDKWIVATKFSGQKEGLTATVEEQLRRLATDRIDFYQLHWVPKRGEDDLYNELYRLKRDGKVRFVGASLYSVSDIDYVIDRTAIDGFQICFSLLDPLPFLARLQRVREKKVAVVVRSCLKEGFLSGKYSTASVFADEHDQRREWSREKIVETIEAVERILGSTELGWDIYHKLKVPDSSSRSFISDEICFATVTMSKAIKAKAIISMTQTGYTAYKIASGRPNCDIFIFTASRHLLTRLSLVWNVRAYYYDKRTNTDDTVSDVIEVLKKDKLLKTGDIVINTAAMPVIENTKTNTLKISTVK